MDSSGIPLQVRPNLLGAFKEEALRSGFAAFGGFDLDQAQPELSEHSQKYQKWLEQGLHGEMQYLQRGLDRRKNINLLFPNAKSVVCGLWGYPSHPLPYPKHARYLRGGDYHLVIKERLEKVIERVSRETELSIGYKICVDTSAVLERAIANLCGLGFIGKNTMLIHPTLGSYFLIGVALLDLPLGNTPVIPTPTPSKCGNCTRCLDGCPTSAFVESGKLDSRKCISYLTLEKRSPFTKEENELTFGKTYGFVAGCDICQEVCPFNHKRVVQESHSNAPSAPHLEKPLSELMRESESQYLERVKGTALDRVKFQMAVRNLGLLAKSDSK